VKFLADTQILIWLAYQPEKLSAEATNILFAEDADVQFSTVSLWEVALKRSRNRSDFEWDVQPLREGLIANEYAELELTGKHVLSFGSAAPKHRDPFDRLLLAQAICEGMFLLTADHVLARQEGPIRFVG
jgi:PIN domain nuclease of toxin-antitoxin system